MGPLHAQHEAFHGRTLPIKGRTLLAIDFPLLADQASHVGCLPCSHREVILGVHMLSSALGTSSPLEIIQAAAFSWSPESIRPGVLPTPSHVINCPR